MSIIKKFFREILIVILAIIVFGSVRQCSVNKSDNTVLLHENDSAFSVAKYYMNKHGQAVGQVKTYELTLEQYKKFGEQLGFENGDLKKQVGKEKRLVAHWKGQAEMKGTAVISLRDTTIDNTMDASMDLSGGSINIEKAKVFEYSNKYLTLNGIIHIDSNQLAIRYQYSSDFSLTAYRKPQGLFKSPQLVADIWFEDPNMKVREFKGFVIQQPKKRFIETGLFKVSVGIGIGYVLAKTL